MPLPKPPAKRAAILAPADFERQPAAKAGRRPAKPRVRAETPDAGVLEKPAAAPSTRVEPVAQPSLRRSPVAEPPARAAQQLPAVRAEAANQSRARKPRGSGPAKLFVLDTNVLMHDPTSLFRFEEHDVYLPMITLEELDNHKKGMTEVARNARQVSRDLDALAASVGTRAAAGLADGLALSQTGRREAGGKLYFQTDLVEVSLPAGLPQGKADNQILGVVKALREQQPGREVVLVSKDINMRIKARALGLPTEDYFNDRTLDDGDLLYTGVLQLPPDFWEQHGKTIESWNQGGHTYYRISGPIVPALLINQFVYLDASSGVAPLHAKVIEITGNTAVLRTLREYTHQKNAVWGITARNREQNFALNLLMDPDCDFVTLTGTAGTGKTLMTLAAGLAQVHGRAALQRDHRHPRDRAGRRGHRLPARHRGREDEPVDGRARRQPRGAGQERRRAPANGAAPPPTTWCAARSRSRA